MARPKIGPVTRYVRTPEGSDFYGVPIGSPISPDLIKKKNREAATLGLVPPKGAVADASGQIDRSAEQARPVPKVGAPKADGPQKFKVGANEYGVPEGSRIFQPKGKPGMRYIMEPDGTIRAFNEQGEAEVPQNLADKLSGMLESDDRYEEVEFDGASDSSGSAKATMYRRDGEFVVSQGPTSNEYFPTEAEAKARLDELNGASQKPERSSSPVVYRLDGEWNVNEGAGKNRTFDTEEEARAYANSVAPGSGDVPAGSTSQKTTPKPAAPTPSAPAQTMGPKRPIMYRAEGVFFVSDGVKPGAREFPTEVEAQAYLDEISGKQKPAPRVEPVIYRLDGEWNVSEGPGKNRTFDTEEEARAYFDSRIASPGTEDREDLSAAVPSLPERVEDVEGYLSLEQIEERLRRASTDLGSSALDRLEERLLKSNEMIRARWERERAAQAAAEFDDTITAMAEPTGRWMSRDVPIRLRLDDQERRTVPGAVFSTDPRWALVKNSLEANNKWQAGYTLYHVPTGLAVRSERLKRDLTPYAAAFSKIGPLSIDEPGIDHTQSQHKPALKAMRDAMFSVATGAPAAGTEQGGTTEPPARPDLQPGDAATADFIRGAAAGDQVTYYPTTAGLVSTDWTKQADGSWTNASGGSLDEQEMISSLADNVLVTSPGKVSAERFYPGAPEMDRADLQAAYDSLNAHPGFQIAYGLPQGSPLRDREVIGAMTTAARAKYPDVSPKQAVLAHMRDFLGIQDEAPEDAPEADGPQITVGAAEPKRTGVQGMNGGAFSRADIAEAVDILEQFQGKAFKSELNKKGNALGVLDPSSIVGIEKDKTIAKQKFIDYLKGILDANPEGAPEDQPGPAVEDGPTTRTPEELVGQSPETLAEVQGLPVGARVQFLGVTYVRTEDGPWQALNWTAQDYTTFTDEELAGALRGVTVLRVDTPLDEYVTRVPNGSIEGLRVGESIVARNSMSTQVWTRSPDEDGVRVWRDLAGNANYEDNMPEVLLGFQESFQESTLWYLRRDPQAPENAPVNYAGWGGDSSIPLPPPPNSIEATNVPNRFNVGDLPNAQWMRTAPIGSAIWKSGDPTSTRSRSHTWVRVTENEWTNEEGTARAARDFPSADFSGIDKILRVGTGESQDSEETPDPEETPQASSADQFAEPTGPWEWASTGGSGGLRYMVIRKVKNHPSGNSTIYDQTSNGNERMFRSPEAAIARAEALNALPDNQGVFFRVLDPSDFITDRTEAGDQIVLRSDGADAMTYTRGVPDSDGGVPWTDSTGGVHYATDLPEAFSLDVEGIEGRATWHVRRAQETPPGVNTFPGTDFPYPMESVPYAVGTDVVGGRPSADFIRGGAAPGSAVRLRARAFLNQPEDAILVRTNDGEWVDANGRVFDQYNLGAVTIRSDTTILRIGDGSPQPEPEETPEPEILEFTPGQEVMGTDLYNMPNGTRLAYTRKDGRQTFYTVQRDESVIVTDRGTDVDFSRAARMRFTVESVPGDEPEEGPEVPADDRLLPSEGSEVGAVGELRAVAVGSVFRVGAVYYMKVGEDLWRSSQDNEDYSVRDFRFNINAARWFTVQSQPTPVDELPWFSPPKNPDWEPIPLQPGDEIPRMNLDDALDALPEGTYIQFTANDLDISARKDADGKWVLASDQTSAAGFSSGTIESLSNQSRSPVVVKSLPVERVPEGAVTDPLSALYIRNAVPGTVVEVRPLMQAPYRAKRTANGWIMDRPSLYGTHSGNLESLANDGRVFLPSDGSTDFETPWILKTYQELDALPTGAIVRIGQNMVRVKTDMGLWESPGGTSTTVTSTYFYEKGGARTSPEGGAEVLYNPESMPEMPAGFRAPVPYLAEGLPVGSIVENVNGGSLSIRMADGTWAESGPLAIRRNASEFARTFASGFRVIQNGPTPLDADPEIGQEILPEQIMQLPVGSRFEVSRNNRYSESDDAFFPPEVFVKVGPDHISRVGDGLPLGSGSRDFIASLKYDSGIRNQRVVYVGVDERANAPVVVGGKVATLDQLRAIPVGGVITSTDSNGFNFSAVRVDSGMFVVNADQTSFNETSYYTPDELFYQKGLTFDFSENVTRGARRGTIADAAGAPEGTILVESDEILSSYRRSEKGQWVAPTGEILTDEELSGTEYLIIPPSKVLKNPKPSSVFEVSAATPGTVVSVKTPRGLQSKRRSYRFDGEDWRALDGSQTEMSRGAMVAASGRGAVTITKRALSAPANYDELRAQVAEAKTPTEVFLLVQAYHPDANWIPWDFSRGDRVADREVKFETYKRYMVETARMFDDYPETKGLLSVGMSTDIRDAYAWVSHPRSYENGGPSLLTASRLNFHSGTNAVRVESGYQTGLRNNYFHGTARPGITPQARIAVHEFGHVLDSMTGFGLGRAATTAYREYINRYPEGAARDAVKDQQSEYSRTNPAELVAETFENWTTNVEVEPLTEHVMQAIIEEFRRSTNRPDFEFKKHPGVEGAPSNPVLGKKDPKNTHSRGSDTAETFRPLSIQEASDVPVGTVVTVDGKEWVKEEQNTWRRDDGFVSFSDAAVEKANPLGGMILKDLPQAGAYSLSAFEEAPTGTRVTIRTAYPVVYIRNAVGNWRLEAMSAGNVNTEFVFNQAREAAQKGTRISLDRPGESQSRVGKQATLEDLVDLPPASWITTPDWPRGWMLAPDGYWVQIGSASGERLTPATLWAQIENASPIVRRSGAYGDKGRTSIIG